MSPRPEFRLVRVYDTDDPGEAGYRVLVDRLWPRGVTRADAALDEWLKDAAPSAELRRWYGHDVQRFEEFASRYRAELGRSPASVAADRLIALARTETITLLTATRDVEHSGARVLRDHLLGRASRSRRRTRPPHRPADDAVRRGDRTGDGEGSDR
jgi:uncharacterized protein YeaO (DUF488 family)